MHTSHVHAPTRMQANILHIHLQRHKLLSSERSPTSLSTNLLIVIGRFSLISTTSNYVKLSQHFQFFQVLAEAKRETDKQKERGLRKVSHKKV